MSNKQDGLTKTRVGVFSNNRSKPIHRWYPFVEGYSAELVEWGLALCTTRSPRVLDPFGGSGTTALAAAEAGLDSWFCEVNPYLAWVAEVKVNQTQAVVSTRDLDPLLELRERLGSSDSWLPLGQNSPLLEVQAAMSYFPEGVADQVVAVLAWLDRETEGPTRELGRLAVAVSLVPSSNMIRRTDLRRRTSRDPQPKPFLEHLSKALTMILQDLADLPVLRPCRATHVSSDIRRLDVDDDCRFDLIITSPPYLNGTNYFRNTKLELVALGFIGDEGELSGLRAESITAGINNVTKRRSDPGVIGEVEEVAVALDAAAYDKRIPRLVRLYFSDMRDAMEAMRGSVGVGTELLLDIGDSRFAGVGVPTHELLRVVGEQVGWAHRETVPVRERRSYDGSKLVQVVERFVAR